MNSQTFKNPKNHLLGKAVHNAQGKVLGRVTKVNGAQLEVERRKCGVGPVEEIAVIYSSEVDRVQDSSIYLLPSQADYWQMPA